METISTLPQICEQLSEQDRRILHMLHIDHRDIADVVANEDLVLASVTGAMTSARRLIKEKILGFAHGKGRLDYPHFIEQYPEALDALSKQRRDVVERHKDGEKNTALSDRMGISVSAASRMQQDAQMGFLIALARILELQTEPELRSMSDSAGTEPGWEILNEFPDDEARVLRLRFAESKSIFDVSRAIGQTQQNVWESLARSRATLREELDEQHSWLLQRLMAHHGDALRFISDDQKELLHRHHIANAPSAELADHYGVTRSVIERRIQDATTGFLLAIARIKRAQRDGVPSASSVDESDAA